MSREQSKRTILIAGMGMSPAVLTNADMLDHGKNSGFVEKDILSARRLSYEHRC